MSDRALLRIQSWRSEAVVLHRRGCEATALLLEQCAREIEEDLTSQSVENALLSIDEAAAETGYSVSGIRKMIARNAIPNLGKPYAPRVRTGDLKPIKRSTTRHEQSR